MNTSEDVFSQTGTSQVVVDTSGQSASIEKPLTRGQIDKVLPQPIEMDSHQSSVNKSLDNVADSDAQSTSNESCPNGAKQFVGTVVMAESYKKRRMDSQQCLTHSQTSPGALALTNPSIVKTTNQDSNRGLYPRQSSGKSHHQFSSPTKTRSPHSPRRRRSPKEIPNQSRLHDFFPPLDRGSSKDLEKVCNVQSNPSSSQLPHVKRSLPFSSRSSPSAAGASPTVKMPSSPAKPSGQRLHPQFQRYTPLKESKLPCAKGYLSPKKQSQLPSASAASRNTPPKQTKPSSSIGLFPNRTKPPSAMGNLLDDFDKDTHFDSMEVEAIVSQAESNASCSPCKSSQESTGSHVDNPPSQSDILDDFENDTFFDCSAVLDIVEKAESDTSSPCKRYANTFGLLGEGTLSDDEDTSDEEFFSKLPMEVMENIFCRLPMTDLCHNINVVCKAWNDIICREKFLYWKKKYHQYKLGMDETCAELFTLINQHNMLEERSFLLQIIKFVQHFRNWIGSSMLNDLKRHHNFQLANDLIKERVPKLAKDMTISPWCIIAALAILSESVADVTLILTCLLNPMATCTAMDAIECLYCVATLLLMLQRRHITNRGLHYRVFYALYLYENSYSDISTKPSLADRQQSPQSLWKFGYQNNGVRLTHEQVRIVAYDPKPEEVVKIVAFAGSGKTTTLIRYAQRRPNMKFLYVAFNRSVKDHAQQVFPPNVTSKTTHSLAYATVGHRYSKQLTSSLMPKYVHELLPPTSKMDKTKKTGLHWITRAKLVIDTLKLFMNSKEEFITTLHVPNTMPDKNKQPIEIPHSDKMKLADDATRVWEQLIDDKNKKARITHDVYLKLYQLKKPVIGRYDCILIDEAQDLTPVQQDILLNQRCAKILVGDPNQQIYSFRGAQNAMDAVERHLEPGKVIKTFHLTQSFRFGPEIAYVSNLVLELFKGNKTQNIVGKGEPGGILGDEVGTVAIICRSNLELFDQAVRICDEATAQKKRLRIGFAGGVKGYGLDILLDIFLLYLPPDQRKKDPREIKTGLIKGFKSFQDLKGYAMNAMDIDLENKIKIVQKYNFRIPAIIADIYAREIHTEYADIILSTTHKSKGLEFDTVKLTEDYGALTCFLLRANGENIPKVSADEMNLVYVAITRAKKRLILNHSLMKFLQVAHEYFVYPVSTQSVLAKHDTVPKCLECDNLIEASNESTSTVMIGKKPKLKLCFAAISEGSMPTNDGYICGLCTAGQCPWYEDMCTTEKHEGVQGSQDDPDLLF